ncbi:MULTISPECIES: DUF655 domain-containing protein [Spirulina sp. CCY15215]|uniref:DUF655 domain-containing protein n=1 Tax=Spirulina sp. CCY15215 TaxID=2767591 RepID=UPI0032AF3C08
MRNQIAIAKFESQLLEYHTRLTQNELKSLLKGISNINNIVKNLVEARKEKEFESLVDFRERVKGVGDATALKICDRLLSE